jgi:hypothetical protein
MHGVVGPVTIDIYKAVVVFSISDLYIALLVFSMSDI